MTERDGEQEEMFCRVCDPVDDEAEEESEAQRPLPNPGMPTRREILEHNLTHFFTETVVLSPCQGEGQRFTEPEVIWSVRGESGAQNPLGLLFPGGE